MPPYPVRRLWLTRLTLCTARPEEESTCPGGAVASPLPKWAVARRGFRQRPFIAACPLAWRPARVLPPVPGSVASQRDDPGPDYRTGAASS